MQTVRTPHATTPPKREKAAKNGVAPMTELTLDALAERSSAELAELYAHAPSATSIRAVEGAPKGRMLAVRFLDGSPLSRPLRAFAASAHFLWDGKTFAATSDQEGRGINRVQITGALGRQQLFPFLTRFGASGLDGEQTLILDYDLPENPPWIRKIHDEIRQVAPGLFLGPAMWKSTADGVTKYTQLLWFALDPRARN